MLDARLLATRETRCVRRPLCPGSLHTSRNAAFYQNFQKLLGFLRQHSEPGRQLCRQEGRASAAWVLDGAAPCDLTTLAVARICHHRSHSAAIDLPTRVLVGQSQADISPPPLHVHCCGSRGNGQFVFEPRQLDRAIGSSPPASRLATATIRRTEQTTALLTRAGGLAGP